MILQRFSSTSHARADRLGFCLLIERLFDHAALERLEFQQALRQGLERRAVLTEQRCGPIKLFGDQPLHLGIDGFARLWAELFVRLADAAHRQRGPAR